MNRVDIVKELLPVMGGVQNKDGDTVLHIAVRTQQPVTVMWMVKLMRREDLEVKNNFALTALNIAVRMRNVRIINVLLPYGITTILISLKYCIDIIFSGNYYLYLEVGTPHVLYSPLISLIHVFYPYF